MQHPTHDSVLVKIKRRHWNHSAQYFLFILSSWRNYYGGSLISFNLIFSYCLYHLLSTNMCLVMTTVHISHDRYLHPPSNKGGHGKLQKKLQKEVPEHFGLIRGELGDFSYLAGGQRVLGPFFVGVLPPLPVMFFNWLPKIKLWRLGT